MRKRKNIDNPGGIKSVSIVLETNDGKKRLIVDPKLVQALDLNHQISYDINQYRTFGRLEPIIEHTGYVTIDVRIMGFIKPSKKRRHANRASK